jgi:RimJ/RimL family protein N-acetyltransferase
MRAEPITTARLDLVPLRVEHAAEMAAALSDPALHTFIGGAPATAEELHERYGKMVKGSPDPHESWLNWVISLRSEDRLTGYVQATVAPRARRVLYAEIAWVVGTPWQGRGIATEAARGLVGWLSGKPIDVVVAHVHPRHDASAAVATAAGLTPTDEEHDGEILWRRDLAPPDGR